ncbi:MAG: MBL fold metallo-hydrolase [Clostridia bacterium]|nr:MBL fold metallo-hydrolase [Clostridia bacterium]
MDKKQYKGYIAPGKVFGPIYFAGVHSASTHIIDTGDGRILIDPGFPDTLWIVLDNIKELGFGLKDIKKIVITHGHYDHAGGVKELTVLCGAETYIGKDDFKMVTGEEDTALSDDPGYRYKYSFTPDVLLSDTDTISLGFRSPSRKDLRSKALSLFSAASEQVTLVPVFLQKISHRFTVPPFPKKVTLSLPVRL